MPISEYLRALRERVGHELLLVPSASVLVFDEERRILMARHVGGEVWVTPGGSIDPDETPADAAVREMREETGLLVEPVRLLGVYGGPGFRVTYPNGDECAYLVTAFECRIVGGSMRPDGEEVAELRWMSLEEIVAARTHPWVPEVLPRLVAARDGWFQPPHPPA